MFDKFVLWGIISSMTNRFNKDDVVRSLAEEQSFQDEQVLSERTRLERMTKTKHKSNGLVVGCINELVIEMGWDITSPVQDAYLTEHNTGVWSLEFSRSDRSEDRNSLFSLGIHFEMGRGENGSRWYSGTSVPLIQRDVVTPEHFKLQLDNLGDPYYLQAKRTGKPYSPYFRVETKDTSEVSLVNALSSVAKACLQYSRR